LRAKIQKKKTSQKIRNLGIRARSSQGKDAYLGGDELELGAAEEKGEVEGEARSRREDETDRVWFAASTSTLSLGVFFSTSFSAFFRFSFSFLSHWILLWESEQEGF
jgi:hypothetical protein